MEGKQRAKPDREFKQQAVALADSSGKPDRQIEKELGIYQGAIRTWRKALEADPEHAFPGSGKLKPVDEELRRLRREVEVLRQERDILKKAAAIFLKPPKAGTDL